MDDLSLVPIEKIYAELDRRMPTYIMLSLPRGAGPEHIGIKITGSITSCLGMMDAVSHRLKNQMTFFGGTIQD